MSDVIGQERRVEGAEIGRAVGDLGDGDDRHVECSGLQELQHLRLVPELGGREDGNTVRAARLFCEIHGEALRGLGPDVGRWRQEAEAEVVRDGVSGEGEDRGPGQREARDADVHVIAPRFCVPVSCRRVDGPRLFVAKPPTKGSRSLRRISKPSIDDMVFSSRSYLAGG